MSQASARSTVSIALLPTAPSPFLAQWEADVVAAARSLAGFLESEVYPPVPGLQDRWILILRFDGQAGVTDWLRSEQRTTLLEQVGAQGPLEQVITGAGSIKKPVTVLVTTRVKPEDIAEFKAWQAEVFDQQRRFPGYIDGKLLAPVAGMTDEWTISMRFDTEQHLDDWLQSKERRDLMAKVSPPMRGQAPRKIVADLGGWFQVKSSEEPPSDWKQALCVLLALYPTVIGLAELNLPGRAWPAMPFALQMLINNVLSIILLTWVLMPRLTKLLQPWLTPPMEQARSTTTKITIAVTGGILLELLVFLKLA
jgi:antibiotic biosynthesis monooxygenase (ABM) superfamily enzyme